MSVKLWDECDCDCHARPGIVHMVPCCNRCPYCRRERISREVYEEHVKKCSEVSMVTDHPFSEWKRDLITSVIEEIKRREAAGDRAPGVIISKKWMARV